MTPTTPGLRPIIEGVRRMVRRDASLALATALLCLVPAALVVAWLLGLLRPWSQPGFGPLLLDLAILGAAGGMAYYGVRRWIRGIDEDAIAADAERRAGMPEGTVRGALELSRNVPDGTSQALARRAEAEIGRHFAGIPRHQVSGELGARVRRRRSLAVATFTTLCLTAGLLAFAAPEHSRAAWTPLAQPMLNLSSPPLPPLGVSPGDATVLRGASFEVTIDAPTRAVVTLRWKAEGQVAREEIATVRSGGAVALIPRVDEVTDYWVEAPDGAASRRYRLTPVDPLLLADLAVDVLYPPYAGRPAERFSGDLPPLELPEGTQLVFSGRATRPLAAAGLNGSADDGGVRFQVEGAAFSGTFAPRHSGIYAWRLQDAAGGELAVAPAPLDIAILRDAAPIVDIRFPDMDTILDASLRQAIVADARDDYGLQAAAVVSWRVGRDGRRHPEVEDAITLSGDDRALIRTLLDGRERDLVPGDTLKFFVRVTDNSPRRQTGTSRTIALRLPSTGEMRQRANRDADELLTEAAALAGTAARMHETTRGLERRTAAANARRGAQQQSSGNRSGGSAAERMDHQETSQARQMLEQQEALLERLEAMRRSIDELERALQQSGLQDSELQERIAELRKLYDELLTPDVHEQLEQLRRAIEELDPQALQQALEDMARQQEAMKQQLEASVEMMRQAAAEQEMNSLAQEARELATQQQALAQAISEGQPTPEQAKAQQELADRARELARELAEMQQKLEQHGETTASEQTRAAQQDAQQAGEQMQQAAQDVAKQDGATAAERGAQAAAQLENAAENLDQARRSMAEGRKQQAQESVQQATSDALSLAQRQQQLLDQMKEAEQAGEQSQDPSATQPPRLPQAPQPPQPQASVGQQRQPQQQGQQQGQQQQGQQGQQGQQQQGQQGQQGQQQQGQQQQGQQGQQGRQGQQGQQGQQGRQGGQQGAGQGQGEGQPQSGQQPGQGAGAADMQGMRSEQAALQQGLQQLGRNLQEAAERSGVVNREVSAALARANLNMQQTLEALQGGQMPLQQAQQTVDALNRLALSLLNSSQQMEGGEGGSGVQQAAQQLTDLARQQSSVNGQSSSLAPMNLSSSAMSQQLNRLAAEQMEIARRLGNLNQGGRESPLGDVDAMAREAEAIAQQLRGGGLPPEVLARQERLFHRLLDAGRSLEKDEYEEERKGERARRVDRREIDALDARLFEDPTRFRAPTVEELQALPPAYRRLILDYFERLNRPLPPTQERPTPR